MQFNLVIRFHPGKLGAKPDALTRRWDIYPKEGDKGFARVNPQNLRPVFTTEQLNASLRATHLQFPVLQASVLMDIEQLHNDILSALPSDPIAQIHLSDTSHPCWSIDATGLLRLDGRIFVSEGDGQTERSNQTLEQYLHVYCNYQQENWSDLLPLTEFAYNNAPSATTGVSPFFANKGYHPNLAVHPERDLSSARAREYAVDLELLHKFLRIEMATTQKCYQGPADAKRSHLPDFKVGDQVFVKAKYFRSTRPSKKLSEKNLGPYFIIAQVGSLLFTIRLPDSMCAVHPVFHVSQLEPTTPNVIPNHVQPPPPPIEVDGEPESKITEITRARGRPHRRFSQSLP